MNERSPLPQSHSLPRLCFQPPDSLTTSTPPPPLPTFPSFSTVSLAGARGSFRTPLSHLKVHLEAFCDGRRRGRNMGGNLSTMTIVLRGLGTPGKVQNEEKCTYAGYCEAAPSPWGHTERLCGPAQGEKAGVFLGYPMHWYNLFLHREPRKEWGKHKVMAVHMMEGRMIKGCYHSTTQDAQPDLEFLSDSEFHGRNVGC